MADILPVKILKAVYRFLEKYILNERLSWQLLMLMALLLSLMPFYFFIRMPLFSSMPVAAPAFPQQLLNNQLLLLHIFTAVPPLVLGPFLFQAKLRRDRPALHRRLGKIYIFCCLVSAVTSFPLALSHPAGVVPRMGFGCLAVAWFVFTWLAYRYALRRDFPSHRRWMFRSYACTFAFVNVKVYVIAEKMMGLGLHPLTIKIMQSCGSWMFNLIVAEFYLAATTFMGAYAGHQAFVNNLRKVPLRIFCFLSVFLSACWISATFFPVDTSGTRFDIRNVVPGEEILMVAPMPAQK